VVGERDTVAEGREGQCANGGQREGEGEQNAECARALLGDQTGSWVLQKWRGGWADGLCCLILILVTSLSMSHVKGQLCDKTRWSPPTRAAPAFRCPCRA
jgi:hypothetical protein